MKIKPSLAGKTYPKRIALHLKTAFATSLLLLTLTGAVQAQDFTFTVNNGTITITGYTGPGGAVTTRQISFRVRNRWEELIKLIHITAASSINNKHEQETL